MTRINTCAPINLLDQHLTAEHHEFPRVFDMVLAAQNRGETPDTYKIPEYFRLGSGHMKFFADKLFFMSERHNAIVDEMLKRGFTVNYPYLKKEFTDDISHIWFGQWTPSLIDVEISLMRLDERLKANPNIYKYYGRPVSSDFYERQIIDIRRRIK